MKRYIKKVEEAVQEIMEGKEKSETLKLENKSKTKGFMAPTKPAKETDVEAPQEDVAKKMASFIADIRKLRMEIKNDSRNKS